MRATVTRTRDAEGILLRNAARIGPGLKSNLMFHETSQNAPGTTFARAVNEMFEATGQKDGYYHYYVATDNYAYDRFVIEVLPHLDSICVPARRMTWEEFESDFHSFGGGTCRIHQSASRRYDITIVIRELRLVEYDGGHMLWVGVPEGQNLVRDLLDFKPFTYKGMEFRPGEGFPIPYDPLWRSSSDLGLVPFDQHDGSVGLADCNFGITFSPPCH